MKSNVLFSLVLFLQTVVTHATTVTNIAAGESHSLFIQSDGSLWAMGWNASGQLGDGTFDNTNRPKQIISTGVVAAAGGRLYSLFLKTDGSLWGMGDLGNGASNST